MRYRVLDADGTALREDHADYRWHVTAAKDLLTEHELHGQEQGAAAHGGPPRVPRVRGPLLASTCAPGGDLAVRLALPPGGSKTAYEAAVVRQAAPRSRRRPLRATMTVEPSCRRHPAAAAGARRRPK
jgi:hypothetical protein